MPAGTTRHYRVYAVNAKGLSDQFGTAMAKTDAAEVPGMPTMVTAMADSDTQITVSWQSPADDGGAAITGYMVESAYMMSDGMMSDWMAVDPAHMGMDMMYVDMGLMEMTKYYYRVSAMNSVGTGMPSDGMAYAMTDRTNAMPMAEGTIAAVTVTEGMSTPAMDVSMYFSDADPEDAMLSYSAMSDMMQYATVSVSGSMVTIMGVAPGMAIITVTATDTMGAYAMQTIMVTVNAAGPAELGAPTNVMATVDDSDPGAPSVTITWGPADNADRYIAVLFDSNFEFDTDHVATHQTDGSVTFNNVAAGTYTAAVISIMDDASGNAVDLDFAVAAVTVN